MNLCFANVTYAGQDFWKFVEVHRGMYQFFGVEGLTLDKTRTTDVLRTASAFTLRSVWTPARRTWTGGTAGGVAVMRDERGSDTALEAFPGQAHVLPAEHPFKHLVPVVFRLEPFAAALTMVCLTDGAELGSRNPTEYADLALMVRQMITLWNFAQDWSVSPGVIAGSAWPRHAGRVDDTSQGTAHSCQAGKGNLIAFAVTRPDLAPLVQCFDLAHGAPLKPCAGMHLIDSVPAENLPMSGFKASDLPEFSALPKNEWSLFIAPSLRCTGQTCFREATDAMPRGSRSITQRSHSYLARADAAERLGQLCASFVEAIEWYLTGQFGRERATPARAQQFSRAAGPQIVRTHGRARKVFTRYLHGCAADPVGQLTMAVSFWYNAIDAASSKQVVRHTVYRLARRASCAPSDQVLPCSEIVAGDHGAPNLGSATLPAAAEAISTSAAAPPGSPAAGTSSYLIGYVDDLKHQAANRSFLELGQEHAESTDALFAVLLILKFTYGDQDLQPGCKRAVDGLTWQDRPRCPQAEHGDLWRASGRDPDDRPGRMLVSRIRVHRNDAEFLNADRQDDDNLDGNLCADIVAAADVGLNRLPRADTEAATNTRRLTGRIPHRLVATHTFGIEHPLKRVADDRPPQDPRASTSLQRIVEAFGAVFGRPVRSIELMPRQFTAALTAWWSSRRGSSRSWGKSARGRRVAAALPESVPPSVSGCVMPTCIHRTRCPSLEGYGSASSAEPTQRETWHAAVHACCEALACPVRGTAFTGCGGCSEVYTPPGKEGRRSMLLLPALWFQPRGCESRRCSHCTNSSLAMLMRLSTSTRSLRMIGQSWKSWQFWRHRHRMRSSGVIQVSPFTFPPWNEVVFADRSGSLCAANSLSVPVITHEVGNFRISWGQYAMDAGVAGTYAGMVIVGRPTQWLNLVPLRSSVSLSSAFAHHPEWPSWLYANSRSFSLFLPGQSFRMGCREQPLSQVAPLQLTWVTRGGVGDQISMDTCNFACPSAGLAVVWGPAPWQSVCLLRGSVSLSLALTHSLLSYRMPRQSLESCLISSAVLRFLYMGVSTTSGNDLFRLVFVVVFRWCPRVACAFWRHIGVCKFRGFRGSISLMPPSRVRKVLAVHWSLQFSRRVLPIMQLQPFLFLCGSEDRRGFDIDDMSAGPCKWPSCKVSETGFSGANGE